MSDATPRELPMLQGERLSLFSQGASVEATPRGRNPARAPLPRWLLLLVVLVSCQPPVPVHPNVVLYIVDTLRADAVGTYGGEGALTPHFDALAREGVIFENAYANSSWTRASTATLLTGVLPWRHSTEGRWDRLPDQMTTLPELLAEAGYSTALVSANPNVATLWGFARGFDTTVELFPESAERLPALLRSSSEVVNRAALEWLVSAESPFFLVVLAIDPHAPYRPPQRFDPGWQRGESQLLGRILSLVREDLTSRERARVRELYRAEVAYTDHCFDQLLAVLTELGVARDTVLILTSDHGEEFWEHGRRGHGQSLSEEVLRVPLVIRYPASRRVPPASVRRDPAQLADITPTVLDLAGLPIPAGLDGRSLFSAESGSRPPLMAGLRMDGHHLVAAREKRWKLVWDRNSDSLTLHDLSLAAGAERVVSPMGDGAEKARQRLLAALVASLRASEEAGARTDPVETLPEDVDAGLRALGYLEGP